MQLKQFLAYYSSMVLPPNFFYVVIVRQISFLYRWPKILKNSKSFKDIAIIGTGTGIFFVILKNYIMETCERKF